MAAHPDYSRAMPQMQLEEYEKLDPRMIVQSEAGPVSFCTPNSATAWRVDTLFTKEPDTISWIAGFAGDDTLLDIGANVGMYSIWAAKTRAVRVLAFEPESQNFALLNRNILANGLAGQVTAYCVALSDKTGFGELALAQFLVGGSGHNYGSGGAEAASSVYRQGCFSTSVDALVAAGDIPVPSHIKIDVDGIEPAIVRGASATLRDPRLRSLLIEINTNVDEHWEIVDVMLSAGFDYSREQVERAQRKEGLFKGVGNYVFRR
jgi:FkbM family methyltransferase